MSESTSENPLGILRRRRRDMVVMYVFLIAVALWWLFPLVTMLRESLEHGGIGNFWWVLSHSLNGVHLPRALLNSLVIAVIDAALVCTVGSLAGYAFSRIQFPCRETTYTFVLVFLAVPGTAMLVPIYYITGQLGLFNSYLGVALPEAALTLPFAVLLMRNAFDGLSDSLFEAASIDGAGHLRKYFSVALPLVVPTMINLGVLCLMWSMHNFIFPSVLITDPDLTTAAQAVQNIRGVFAPTPQETSRFFAALSVLTIPILAIVVISLRWMRHGIAVGGSKE